VTRAPGTAILYASRPDARIISQAREDAAEPSGTAGATVIKDIEMNITGIHHVAIIASDYERSRRFYTEVLGFEVLAEAHRHERNSYKLDLRCPGGVQLELFSFPAPPKRVTRPEACGLRHLAFRVPDIRAAVTELQRQAVEVEPIRVDEYTGRPFTFFADPDGLPIELYEESAAGDASPTAASREGLESFRGSA
jgi:glyoxylase I family protein